MSSLKLQNSMRPAAAHLFGLTLRRAVLTAGRNIGDLLGLLDCAEIALALCRDDEARLFFEIAFIAGGYDKAALVMQDRFRQETGLWELSELRPIRMEPPSSSLQGRLDTAASDLRKCVALAGRYTNLTSAACLPAAGSAQDWAVQDLYAAVHALHGALQSPFAFEGLAAAAASVQQHPLVAGDVSLEEHVDASIETLVALLAAKAMKHFVMGRYALILGPLASPALLHEVAGFDRRGLGPYFVNAANVVPALRNLIGLTLAAMDRDISDPEVHRGLALLAVGLQSDPLRDFVEVLADLGLLNSIYLISARFGYASEAADRPVLWTLRDAAMDLGEARLASSLQAQICKLAPQSAIEASMLVSLEANDVPPHGFGSTAGRSQLRRSRLRALSADRATDPVGKGSQPFEVLAGNAVEAYASLRREGSSHLPYEGSTVSAIDDRVR